LRILAFTDFHGNQEAYQHAKVLIANEKPDFVIVAGDIINYDPNKAKLLLFDLAAAGSPVYFVPGNMDGEELGNWAGEKNVHALHGRCENREGVSLIGLGGSRTAHSKRSSSTASKKPQSWSRRRVEVTK